MVTLADIGVSYHADFGSLFSDLKQVNSALDSLQSHKAEITVAAQTAEATKQLAGLEAATAKLSGAEAIVTAHANTEQAYAQLQQMQATLLRMADTPVVIQARADVAAAMTELESLRTEMKAIDDQSVSVGARASEVGGGLLGMAKGAAETAAGFMAASGAMQAISGAFNLLKGATIDTNAELETSTLQFQTLMGSADEAKKHVQDLFQFAAVTPFEAAPVIQASRELRLFGKDALDTKDNLTRVGNAAATAQQPIEELAFWIGRMYSAIQGGQPFGEAAMRLQEMTILSSDARQQMEKMQKQGASANDIWAVMATQLDSFNGAMERQAGTWAGLTSSISDFIHLTGARLFKPLFDDAKAGMASFLEYTGSADFQAKVDDWSVSVEQFAGKVKDFVINDGPGILDLAKNLAVEVGTLAGQVLKLADQADRVIRLTSTNPETRKQAQQQGGTGSDIADTALSAGADVADGLNAAMKASNEAGVAIHNFFANSSTDAVNFATAMQLANGAIIEVDKSVTALMTKAGNANNPIVMPPDPAVIEGWLELAERFGTVTAAEAEAIRAAYGLVSPQQALASAVAASNKEVLDAQRGGAAWTATTMQEAAASGALAQAQFQASQYAHDYAYTLSGVDAIMRSNMGTLQALSALTSQAALAQQGLAAAYQQGLQVQQTYTAQSSEYSGQINTIQAGLKVWEQELANGTITQDQFNQKQAAGNDAIARLQGGMADAATTAADYAIANVQIMKVQDQVNSQFPNLIAGSDAWKQALHDAAIASGVSEDAFNTWLSSGNDLSALIGGSGGLTESINNLITAIHELDGEKATPDIGADTSQADTAVSGVQATFDNFASGEYRAALDAQDDASPKVDPLQQKVNDLTAAPHQIGFTADVSDFNTNVGTLTDDINAFIGGDAIAGASQAPGGLGGYSVPISADTSQADSAIAATQGTVKDFVESSHSVPLTADTGGFDTSIAQAEGTINAITLQTYTVTLDMDITPLLQKAAEARANLPSSPAEKGPLAFTPSWDWIVAPLAGAMDTGVGMIRSGAADMAALLPHSPADTGPLSVTPSWEYITAGVPQAMDAGISAAGTGAAAIVGVVGSAVSDAPAHIGWHRLVEGVAPAMDAGTSTAHDGNTAIARAVAEPPKDVLIDWSWLYRGIDMASEDAGKQVAAAVTGFITNIDGLVSGDTLKTAQQDLQDLFTIHQIEIETGAPQSAIDETNQQIADKQAEVEAIGRMMGTDVIQGLIKQAADEDAGQKLIDAIKQTFDGIDLSNIGQSFTLSDFLGDIPSQLQQLQALRGAAQQLGLTEMVAEYDQQIADLNARATEMAAIFGTESVQAFVASQEAEAKARAEAEAHTKAMQDEVDAITALAKGGDSAASLLTDKLQAFQTASDAFDLGKSLGVSKEEMDQLAQNVRDAGQQLGTLKDDLTSALLSGAIDTKTLQALAAAGGEWFQTLYDQLFGPGALEQLQAGWTSISAENLSALEAMKPDLQHMGTDWVDSIVTGFESGNLDVQQALSLVTDATGKMSDDVKVELLNLEKTYHDNLMKALATGEGVEEAQAQWDQFMLLLQQVAAASGETTDELLADWQQIADQAQQTKVAVSDAAQGMVTALSSVQTPLQTATANLFELHDAAAALGPVIVGAGGGDSLAGHLQRFADAMNHLNGDLPSATANLASLSDVMGDLPKAFEDGAISVDDFVQRALSGTPDTIQATIQAAQSLEHTLVDQLAAALALGTDPTQIKANLKEVEDLIAQLQAKLPADPAAYTPPAPDYGTPVKPDTTPTAPGLDQMIATYKSLAELEKEKVQIKDPQALADSIVADEQIVITAIGKAADLWETDGLDAIDRYGATLSGGLDVLQKSADTFKAMADASHLGVGQMQIFYDNMVASLKLLDRLAQVAAPYRPQADTLVTIAREMADAFEASATVAGYVSLGGANAQRAVAAAAQTAAGIAPGSSGGPVVNVSVTLDGERIASRIERRVLAYAPPLSA